MKTGLGLRRKIKFLNTWINLFCFQWRNVFLGFDVANQFLYRVDKHSIQLILKKYGATIGEDCDIETGLVFHNCNNYSNLIVGNNCHIGKNCFFDLRDKVIIGNNNTISMQSTFITHIDMGKSDLSRIFPMEQSEITIHNNCYIGAGSTILKGVNLNNNCMVAAKSLVHRDVPSNTVVGGIPVKEIKKLQ